MRSTTTPGAARAVAGAGVRASPGAAPGGLARGVCDAWDVNVDVALPEWAITSGVTTLGARAGLGPGPSATPGPGGVSGTGGGVGAVAGTPERPVEGLTAFLSRLAGSVVGAEVVLADDQVPLFLLGGGGARW